MKTYRDVATIKQIENPMELKLFWSIIERCQSAATPDLREYNLMKTLGDLSVQEIVGFPLRIQELAQQLLNAKEWTAQYKQELLDNAATTIEDLALWVIFQGKEFYGTSLQKPLFLIKRVRDFTAEGIPEKRVVTHALGLKIAEEYIHFEDFMAEDKRENLIW